MIKSIKWAGIGLISGMVLLFLWQNSGTLSNRIDVLYLSYSYGMPIGAWLAAFFAAGMLLALFWTVPRIYRLKNSLKRLEKEKDRLVQDFNRRLQENPPDNLPDLEANPPARDNSLHQE